MSEAHSPERWMAENDYDGEPPGYWANGPCYICGAHVPPEEGWHREDFDGVSRHWCPDHQPVWSHEYGPHNAETRACDCVTPDDCLATTTPEETPGCRYPGKATRV